MLFALSTMKSEDLTLLFPIFQRTFGRFQPPYFRKEGKGNSLYFISQILLVKR